MLRSHARAKHIGGGRRAGLRARAQRSGAGADRAPRGFPVHRRPGRHRLRRRRGDRRRRPRLFARRRHGRGLHDGARARAGAPGQARARRHRRRRAPDEHRRARHHRGDRIRRTWRSSASTTAITARPAGRRAIPASASISRRWRSAPASSAPARSRSKPTSPTARACCAKATARRSCMLRVKPTEPADVQAQLRRFVLPRPLPRRVAAETRTVVTMQFSFTEEQTGASPTRVAPLRARASRRRTSSSARTIRAFRSTWRS